MEFLLNSGSKIASKNVENIKLLDIYHVLIEVYGAQHWWPADSDFEMMVGAILVQNSSWQNVEVAIQRMKNKRILTASSLSGVKTSQLSRTIRNAGLPNVKAHRIKALASYFSDGYSDKIPSMDSRPTNGIRDELLSITGIGPETADAILLYAFRRCVGIGSAYARRILSRMGLVPIPTSYNNMKMYIESGLLKSSLNIYSEFHALIVCHAKNTCKSRPDCDDCCFRKTCPRELV